MRARTSTAFPVPSQYAPHTLSHRPEPPTTRSRGVALGESVERWRHAFPDGSCRRPHARTSRHIAQGPPPPAESAQRHAQGAQRYAGAAQHHDASAQACDGAAQACAVPAQRRAGAAQHHAPPAQHHGEAAQACAAPAQDHAGAAQHHAGPAQDHAARAQPCAPPPLTSTSTSLTRSPRPRSTTPPRITSKSLRNSKNAHVAKKVRNGIRGAADVRAPGHVGRGESQG